jgi:hypothetical protein
MDFSARIRTSAAALQVKVKGFNTSDLSDEVERLAQLRASTFLHKGSCVLRQHKDLCATSQGKNNLCFQILLSDRMVVQIVRSKHVFARVAKAVDELCSCVRIH